VELLVQLVPVDQVGQVELPVQLVPVDQAVQVAFQVLVQMELLQVLQVAHQLLVPQVDVQVLEVEVAEAEQRELSVRAEHVTLRSRKSLRELREKNLNSVLLRA
jgi:hypothetical protein